MFGTDIPNPFIDMAGEFCLERQEGSIIFLAGSFVGDGNLTSRSLCEIGPDTWLFFPIVNTALYATENTTSFGPLRDFGITLDDYENLTLTVDGEDLAALIRPTESQGYLIPSTVDNFGNANLYNETLEELIGPFVPLYATIGTYALLPPLLPGEHSIAFTGVSTSFGEFIINTEYNPITVLEEIPIPLNFPMGDLDVDGDDVDPISMGEEPLRR